MKQKHRDKFTDEQLIKQFDITPTLSKLAHHFSVPEITLWRRARKLGLTFRMGGANKKIELVEILEGKHPYYQTLKLKKRIISEGILQNKCSECGIEKWNDKAISMHLDHIDGNSHNHKIDNLRLLCPNCHSQTATWCGRNKT